MKEERFPYTGNLLHWLGGQLGQIRSFRGSQESEADGLWQAGQRESSSEGPCHIIVLPSPRGTSAGMCSSWVLKLRLQWTDLGMGLHLAVQRSPRGLECGLGFKWGCAQHVAWVHHRSPTVNAHRKGGVWPNHSSHIPACSQGAQLYH